MSDTKIDRTKLTFSQADGIDPLPQPAALGELSRQARVLLWNITYEGLQRSRWHNSSTIVGWWKTVLHRYYTFFLHKPTDEFSSDFYNHANKIKSLLLKGDYNRVFDFLQCVLRHRTAAPEFRSAVASVLKDCMCAYTVVEEGPKTTIVPIAMPEQSESMQEAFQVLQSGPFAAARSHLRKSAESIHSGDLAGSIRESIHAVESVACRLNADAETSLKPALDALSKRNVALHPAFKKGIEKFYAYTSDEKGIRHALLEEQANVDRDDAVFMFGACTSFAAYLVNKARKAGLFEP